MYGNTQCESLIIRILAILEIFFHDHFHYRLKVTLITMILEFYLKNHYNRNSMVNLKFAIYHHLLTFLDATVLLSNLGIAVATYLIMYGYHNLELIHERPRVHNLDGIHYLLKNTHPMLFFGQDENKYTALVVTNICNQVFKTTYIATKVNYILSRHTGLLGH